jgi:phage shock protein PspC (stress-responsive transcriptional regulator)
VRVKDGAIFGVCKGFARTLNLPVGMVRLGWLACVLLGGIGLGLYLLLAISLPREDRIYEAMKPRLLGVCALLAKRTELEVGIVRFIFLLLLLGSLGLTAVLYVIGYFFLDDSTGNSRIAD